MAIYPNRPYHEDTQKVPKPITCKLATCTLHRSLITDLGTMNVIFLCTQAPEWKETGGNCSSHIKVPYTKTSGAPGVEPAKAICIYNVTRPDGKTYLYPETAELKRGSQSERDSEVARGGC